MRFRIFKLVATSISLLTGIACLGVAFFAYQLGLDNNITLGPLRKILAGFGGFLVLLPVLIWLINRLLKRFHQTGIFNKKSDQRDEPKSSVVFQIEKTSKVKTFFNGNALLWSGLGVLIVWVVSLWYITNGTMFHFNYYSNYYDLQADGFLAGKTSLLIEPDPALASLADPYDINARTGIHVVWDASYYQGKYYIYWGPMPAVLAALVKWVKPGIVQDQYLLLFFVCGLAVIFASLLSFVRRKYFPSVPAWLLMPLVTLTGLATPLLFLVSRPNVYETAIASCQFFLFLGLYGVVKGLSAASGQWKWMVLAGFGLGASVASRMSIVFTVFFIVGVILVVVWRKKNIPTFGTLAALLIPLALFACALMGFNFVRFGSPLESGMRYQLTGVALPEDFSQLFALRYILPNTYLSLLQPFQFTPHQFPFFTATTDNSWTRIIKLPTDYYFAEQVTGILYTIPFLWLLVIPLLRILQKGWRWVKEIPAVESLSSVEKPPKWMWVMLAGAGLVAFATNMMYILTTMRYLADFSPLFMLFLSVFLLLEIDKAQHSPVRKNVLMSAIVVLGLATILISFFINFTVGDRRMLNENPALYTQLEQFFQR